MDRWITCLFAVVALALTVPAAANDRGLSAAAPSPSALAPGVTAPDGVDGGPDPDWRNEVAAHSLYSRGKRQVRQGTALTATGGVLTGLGGVAGVLVFLTTVTPCPHGCVVRLVYGGIGGAALIGGVPMVIGGASLRRSGRMKMFRAAPYLDLEPGTSMPGGGGLRLHGTF